MRTTLQLLTLSLIALPAWAAPVGMAAHVSGNVQVTQDGKTAPLRLLQRLEDGDAVRCGPNSNAVIVLFGNGSRFQLNSGQRATIHASTVTGAGKLAELSGPSANVVKLLGGARVGAAMSRLSTTFQRLQPNSPGWLESPTPHFEWLPATGAAEYTFTLFDQYDNVVWSLRTTQTGADYPADAPTLQDKRPYLWRVSAFGASGKPLPESRCGLITFLAPENSRALSALAADLQNQANTGGDPTTSLLLAETYRSYGVLGRTLEILEDERLRAEPGIQEAREDVYDSLSPFARVLIGRPVKLNANQ